MSSLTPRLDKIQKNYLINADMRIAQRGASFVAIADAGYSLDRWRYGKAGGTVVHTVSQDTDVPTFAQSGYLFQNSLRMNLTTPDTSLAAGDYATMAQFIEGYNFSNIAQKDLTLSFWVKATLPGTYCVSCTNSGSDRSFVAEYVINAANTWEFKTVTILASPAGGTWNYTNGVGLRVFWTLAAGSTFQTTAGSWQTGNFIATANQVNGINTGATDFRITGVSLVEGIIATPAFGLFGKDGIAELAACKRYYEKSYDISTVPGTVTAAGAYYFMGVGSPNRPFTTVFYKQAKRTTPLLILWSARTGANGSTNAIWDANAGATEYSAAIASYENHFTVNPSAGTPPTSAQLIVHWTADAEL